MKFLEKHRKPLLQAMGKYGFSPDDFEYVKRKGRINIIHSPTKLSFSYFRKKVTSIDPVSRAWVESEFYKVSANAQPEQEIPDWSGVIIGFENWLKAIDISK